jgi:hypothetical protein
MLRNMFPPNSTHKLPLKLAIPWVELQPLYVMTCMSTHADAALQHQCSPNDESGLQAASSPSPNSTITYQHG